MSGSSEDRVNVPCSPESAAVIAWASRRQGVTRAEIIRRMCYLWMHTCAAVSGVAYERVEAEAMRTVSAGEEVSHERE